MSRSTLLLLLASLVAVSVFQVARESRGRQRAVWIATAGLATGCGIWATHFVAMLAYQPGAPVAYEAGLTIGSMLTAVVLCSAGFAQGESAGNQRR